MSAHHIDDIPDGLTPNDFQGLLNLLDRLICQQEDVKTERSIRRANQLADTFQLIADIGAGR